MIMVNGSADVSFQSRDKSVAHEGKDHKTDVIQKLHDDAHGKTPEKVVGKSGEQLPDSKATEELKKGL